MKKTEITILTVKKVTITHPDSWKYGELKQLASQLTSPSGKVESNWDMTDVDFEIDNVIKEIIA